MSCGVREPTIPPLFAERSLSTTRPWRSIPDSHRRGRESRVGLALYANSTPTVAESCPRPRKRPSHLPPTGRRATRHWEATGSLVMLDNVGALEAMARVCGSRRTQRSPGAALAEQALGRWDAALEHFQQAARVIPGFRVWRGPGPSLSATLREARESFDGAWRSRLRT